MSRAWKINSLNVDLHNKRAEVSMSDGAVHVNASFPYDARGDAPESTVREGAIKKAKQVWDDASKANIS